MEHCLQENGIHKNIFFNEIKYGLLADVCQKKSIKIENKDVPRKVVLNKVLK